MSENNLDQTSPPPVQVKEGEHTENFRAVFEDLHNYGVLPTRVIQGGVEFNDFAPDTTREIRDRPFVVMEVEGASGERQIYKKRIGDDPREATNNESFFLQSIAPEIILLLPEHLKDVIRFPGLKGRHVDQKSLLEEYFEGKTLGSVHRASTDLFTSDDLHAIADVIKTIQINGGKWIEDPNLHFKGPAERKAYDKYKSDLQKREKGLRAALGDENYAQLTTLIEKERELLSSDEVFLAAGDIQGSNIIKMDNGQLGMIDWERINTTNNPALDYDFMYAVLWDNPQFQEEYLQYALSQNQDKPNFKEYLRLDFLFNRGTGELNHWWERMQAAQTSDEKVECETAIGRYKSLLGDALNKKGIWGDNLTQINGVAHDVLL